MAKQNQNVICHCCFQEKYVEGCICQWFKFFFFNLFQTIPYIKYKGIFIKVLFIL